MAKQTIISIGREYGSGGHQIAQALADRLSFKFYDRNLLDEIANEKQVDGSVLQKYDEAPRNLLFSRTVRGFSNSPEEVIAQLQFDYLKKKAQTGESFIVVGRCAEEILKEYPGLISIFILGDFDKRIQRIKEIRQVSDDAAKAIIYRHDKKRKSYHNYYCTSKWGDSRSYDLTINSSKLGIDDTIALLEDYIQTRMK